MTLLKEQGIEAGTGLAPEKVDRIVIDVQNYFYEQQGELPEGEALAELQKINPNYRDSGGRPLLYHKDRERSRRGRLAYKEQNHS